MRYDFSNLKVFNIMKYYVDGKNIVLEYNYSKAIYPYPTRLAAEKDFKELEQMIKEAHHFEIKYDFELKQ